MAIAVITETQDVEQQRDRLLGRLADQRDRVGHLWDWYRGRQPHPDVVGKYRQAYELMLAQSVTPWARLVVDAIAERLRVQGVRAEDHPDDAGRAWDAFKRDRLDADQRLIYTDALISGTGYASVAAPDGGEAQIRPESAFEVTHEPDLSDRTQVAAATKLYPYDFTRTLWVCELYRPEATWRWIAQLSKPTDGDAFPIDHSRRRHRKLEWEPLESLPNKHGIVPIVPFENRVNVVSGAASEIEDCVPILQRIDRLTLDMLVSSHFGSFRQKWATGLEVPRDEANKPVEPFKLAVDRLWVNEKDGRFGSFEATELSNYLSAIDAQIAALAAISRVPAHYLMQRNLANPPTAESLVSSETGLVAKVEDRHAQYGEAWEQTFYLQALFSGHPVDVELFEVMWRSAEKRNPAQVADAAIKLQVVGVPKRAIWEYAGFSPQQVDEWSLEADATALLAAAAGEPGGPPEQTGGEPS